MTRSSACTFSIGPSARIFPWCITVTLCAIITQAVALIVTVLIIGQQGYTGGVNGMTDLKTLLGWDTRTDSAAARQKVNTLKFDTS